MSTSDSNPTFVVTTIRVEADLLLRVREAARRDRRTLSGEIATLLEEALAERENPNSLRV
jgi:hypothetical protein